MTATAQQLPAAPPCPEWCTAHDRTAAPAWHIERGEITRMCTGEGITVRCTTVDSIQVDGVHGGQVDAQLQRADVLDPETGQLGFNPAIGLGEPTIWMDGTWRLDDVERLAHTLLELVARGRGTPTA